MYVQLSAIMFRWHLTCLRVCLFTFIFFLYCFFLLLLCPYVCLDTLNRLLYFSSDIFTFPYVYLYTFNCLLYAVCISPLYFSLLSFPSLSPFAPVISLFICMAPFACHSPSIWQLMFFMLLFSLLCSLVICFLLLLLHMSVCLSVCVQLSVALSLSARLFTVSSLHSSAVVSFCYCCFCIY